ncbi:Tn3 family transposase, partial [Klebsiella pneumoniae]
LWRPQTAGPPEHFVVFGRKIPRTPQWDEMIRTAGSLKLGKVQVSVLVRSLLKSERPSGLTQAIIEVGRINKTLYLLNYID